MNGHFSPVAVTSPFLASVVLFGALANAFSSHIPIGTKCNKAMVTPTLGQTTLLAEEWDSATKGPKPIDFKSIMETRDAVFSTLCYDNFISERICVSRPYYMLENDKAVLADLENAIAFSCSVTPKMPLGRECGDMIGGEAGRHMAIAGSVAAALRQKPKSGKHYYLALDHCMTRRTFQGIGTAESGSSSIIATCVDFGKRTAKVEVLLETTGDHPAWHLEVEYAVIPEKVFKKMMRNTAQPEQVAIPGVSSPYKEFKGLPSAPTIVSSSSDRISKRLATSQKLMHRSASATLMGSVHAYCFSFCLLLRLDCSVNLGTYQYSSGVQTGSRTQVPFGPSADGGNEGREACQCQHAWCHDRMLCPCYYRLHVSWEACFIFGR